MSKYPNKVIIPLFATLLNLATFFKAIAQKTIEVASGLSSPSGIDKTTNLVVIDGNKLKEILQDGSVVTVADLPFSEGRISGDRVIGSTGVYKISGNTVTLIANEAGLTAIDGSYVTGASRLMHSISDDGTETQVISTNRRLPSTVTSLQFRGDTACFVIAGLDRIERRIPDTTGRWNISAESISVPGLTGGATIDSIGNLYYIADTDIRKNGEIVYTNSAGFRYITSSGLNVYFSSKDGKIYMYDPNALLPIQLASFKARVLDKGDVEIKWEVASEIDNEKFIVERSLDGITWNGIGEIAGHGRGVGRPKTYKFTDTNADDFNTSRPVYYRLADIATDGTRNVSQVVSVTLKDNVAQIKIWPNPVHEVLNISMKALRDLNNTIEIPVFGMDGRLVEKFRVSAEGRDVKINMGHLPNGQYLLGIGQTMHMVHKFNLFLK